MSSDPLAGGYVQESFESDVLRVAHRIGPWKDASDALGAVIRRTRRRGAPEIVVGSTTGSGGSA